MKKIWLYGASQGLGLEIAKYFSAQGYQIMAMVRDLNKVQAIKLNNITWLQGDALKQQDITHFMTQAKSDDWVISCMGSFRVDEPVDYMGHRLLIDHLQKNNISRFLMVTSLGCGDSWKTLSQGAKNAFGDTLREKSLAESWLQSSTLEYTILRPGGLRDGQVTGHGELSQQQEIHGVITRAEVAQLIEQLLKNRASIGKIYACIDPTLT
ncbi:SDR family oxidoreductase [Psychromonas hadalis]|uniref:SDR family oxidoreductase n=1 Tax=Psychromonas hadalis TaxID=211669 RepID=UPI0003B52F67|nr:SDR family oxidoreductase [Psychromonas hadalis]